MFQSNHLIGFGAFSSDAGAADADCSFVTSAQSTSDATTYTFSSQSFGAEAADRHILNTIAAGAASARTVSSSTIGGVAASELVDFEAHSGSNAAMIIAAVPTGATGDVVVTFTGGMVRCAVGTYRVTGLNSTTPTGSGTDSTDALSASLNISAGGFAVGVVFSKSSPTGVTWTNLAEDVETLAASWETNGNWSSAHENFAAAQTGLALTGDWTGTPNNEVGAFVSMR